MLKSQKKSITDKNDAIDADFRQFELSLSSSLVFFDRNRIPLSDVKVEISPFSLECDSSVSFILFLLFFLNYKNVYYKRDQTVINNAQ